MNDLTPEERDELASAYLDGEATAQERAMVEADADLLARVEHFRHAAEEVASPAAEAGREEIIAEALKAFKPEAEPAKQVEKLASRQRQPRSGFLLQLRERLRNRPLAPILGAAAALAVVFLAIAIFALTNENTDDTSDTASSGTTSPATTFEFAQLLESADMQASEALSDSAAAFDDSDTAAPATTAALATTAAAAVFPETAQRSPLAEIEELSPEPAETQFAAQAAQGPPAELPAPNQNFDGECVEPALDEEEDSEESLEDTAEDEPSVSVTEAAPETSLNSSSTGSSTTTTSLPEEWSDGCPAVE